MSAHPFGASRDRRPLQVTGDGNEEAELLNMPIGIAKNSLKVSHFFDQGRRLEIKPIEPEEITKMRARWQSQMWLPPQKHLNPMDNQLRVLKRLNDLGHNMLAFDMGVWGPYGSRRERHFLLTAHHLNVSGDYQAKEVPGAQSLEDWLEGWAFATTTFVMGGIVERGVADAYAAHFKEMVELSGGVVDLLPGRVGVPLRVRDGGARPPEGVPHVGSGAFEVRPVQALGHGAHGRHQGHRGDAVRTGRRR